MRDRGERWSHFLRQPVKVDSAMKRMIHHEEFKAKEPQEKAGGPNESFAPIRTVRDEADHRLRGGVVGPVAA